jgi:hypothetical protein
MGTYGAKIWPAQVIFYLAAILLVEWILVKPGKLPSFCTKLFLSIAFLWNGILFYLILAKGLSGNTYGNYFIGSFFILVSALFIIDLVRQKMQFVLPPAGWQKYITLSLMMLTFCYPIFGRLSGHDLTSLLTPGTFPCPTIALTLLLLTMALPRVNKIIYIILVFLAIPFTPFFQIVKYGVFEDSILFTCGIFSLILLMKNWRLN